MTQRASTVADAEAADMPAAAREAGEPTRPSRASALGQPSPRPENTRAAGDAGGCVCARAKARESSDERARASLEGGGGPVRR